MAMTTPIAEAALSQGGLCVFDYSRTLEFSVA